MRRAGNIQESRPLLHKEVLLIYGVNIDRPKEKQIIEEPLVDESVKKRSRLDKKFLRRFYSITKIAFQGKPKPIILAILMIVGRITINRRY